MSFEDYDNSVHAGAPIECYKFIGELNTYRYTSNNESVTVDGETYDPQSGIECSAIETTSALESAVSVDIKIPITCPLAIAYNFLKMPITLDVEIRAVHRGSNFATDFKLMWQGTGIGFPVSDTEATIRTQSIVQSALNSQLNQVLFQTSCNHEVYDEHCGLDPADFSSVGIVTDIKGNVITVTNDGFPNGELAIGKMVNDRTGETRVIISNITNVVTVGYAFIDIELGDSVTMIQGCDDSYTMCKNRFNNLINFGGLMFMPQTNPYTDPV